MAIKKQDLLLRAKGRTVQRNLPELISMVLKTSIKSIFLLIYACLSQFTISELVVLSLRFLTGTASSDSDFFLLPLART